MFTLNNNRFTFIAAIFGALLMTFMVFGPDVKGSSDYEEKVLYTETFVVSVVHEDGSYWAKKKNGGLYFYDMHVQDAKPIKKGDKVKAYYLDDNQSEMLFLYVEKVNKK